MEKYFGRRLVKTPLEFRVIGRCQAVLKKNRIKAAHESPTKPNRVTRDGRTITCGNCRKVGHNRLTCKNAAYVVEGPKRKRGRPWKIYVSI